MRIVFVLALLAAAGLLISQPAPREVVGPLPGGGFLLNSGWRVDPAGKQVPVDSFPMSTALSKDGKYLLVLNGGYNPPTVSVIDVAGEKELSRVRVPDAWLGLAISPKGDRVYVGGGSEASVFEMNFSGGQLTMGRTFELTPADKRVHQSFVGDVAMSPDGRLVYASELYKDTVAVINPQSGRVIERFKTGRRPYRILFHPDGQSLFVSSWADASVGHYAAETGKPLETVRVGPHPTDMVWSAAAAEAGGNFKPAARLFVAAANTNSVYSVGVSESKQLRLLESINLAMAPRQPFGMTPTGLALTPDGKRLLAACSDANAVAVVSIEGERSRVEGYLPSGWYPTAVRVLADGRTVIANGRGGGSHPNPKGPNPTLKRAPVHGGIRADEYVGKIQTGTLSFVPPFGPEALEAFSKSVLRNSPYRDALLDDAGAGKDGPIPSKPGEKSPIEHVIYIVKENRTYDQVMGDMKEGNGDPSLVLFPEKISPNHHKLAREFVLLDNFYVNSDVSADGHNWSTAAIASDYVQKMWPNSYAGRRKHYDYEGTEPAALPPAGYIWTNAAAAGVTMRNYGYWTLNLPKAAPDGRQIDVVHDPILKPVTNLKYRNFDLEYKDVDRAKVYLADLTEFEKTGVMPRLSLVRMGNDHTSGTKPGAPTPSAAVADNDYALGMIVEGVSKSKFWAKTVIFVVEDDAQNGPDHVDSHRSPGFVISPYIKRRTVNSTLYNTASMLRTMELILGLRPMTHFDAGARPMTSLFQPRPDLAAYQAEAPRVSLEEKNVSGTEDSARSLRMNFEREDEADDDELNAVLWRAMRGGEPPPPVTSRFSR